MDNQSKEKKEEQVFDLSRRKAIQELFAKHGIECVDKTQESIGKTSVLFWNTPKSEPTEEAETDNAETDEAETYLRYLNMRK